MKKLVTALMIVLPLVFLIALFTVTSVTRITAQIPATGIAISNKGDNGVFAFDIADYEVPLYEEDLNIQVMPLVASNRDYSLSVTDAESGEASDIVELKEDGSFALNDVGIAKLTYTSKDGGYQDSVIFKVSSSGVLKMNAPTVTDAFGNVLTVNQGVTTDYMVVVENGAYNIGANCYPVAVTTAQPRYVARNKSAIDVNEVSGNVQTRFSGNHVVEISVEDARGDLITKTLEFCVIKKSGETTINGKPFADGMKLLAPLNSRKITFYVDADKALSEEEIKVRGTNIVGDCEVRKLDEISDTAYEIVINLEYPLDVDSVPPSYIIELGDNKAKLDVECKEYEFNIHSALYVESNRDILMLEGIVTNFSISSSPINADITYEWKVDDLFKDRIEIVEADGQYCKIKANALGNAQVTVICHFENGGYNTVVKDIAITRNYSSFMFNEIAHSYGLGSLAIANSEYDGNLNVVSTEYKSEFYASVGKDKVSSLEDIEFSSDNTAIAKVEQRDGNVYFDIQSTGKVTITAKSKYAKELKLSPASLTFNAVDGVKVSNYTQLDKASKEGKKVVLANDIYLGEKLFNKDSEGKRTLIYSVEESRAKLLKYTTELKTTADWTYYENTAQGQPSVRYCYEFTNDFFGNGYTLNGEYITNTLDGADIANDWGVFRGPLDFVAAEPNKQKLAAVKAQDNIVFLTRKDDVVIDNVVLKGCDDESIYDNNELNLSLLNNMGTTLEIMSDAKLTNSRVMNGRTVVRVFGRDGINRKSGVNVSAEKINVEIDNCILQNAREFILKIGTNRSLLAPSETNLEPMFANASGVPYENSNSPLCDEYINDDYFVNNYVLTDVILKDSTLRTSGLFTIGMESHFAGPLLYDSASDGTFGKLLPGWKDLAGTSYPAILHLVGDVKLADWKNLENIDSSTLIETFKQDGGFAQIAKWLALDINKMLQLVQSKGGEQYKNIIDVIDGKNYVHGGIAFYGGGRNYSILDASQYTFERMNQYNVNISILAKSTDDTLNKQGTVLPLAAGTQDFRFVMFDASSDYDYIAQQNEMK